MIDLSHRTAVKALGMGSYTRRRRRHPDLRPQYVRTQLPHGLWDAGRETWFANLDWEAIDRRYAQAGALPHS